LLVTARF